MDPKQQENNIHRDKFFRNSKANLFEDEKKKLQNQNNAFKMENIKLLNLKECDRSFRNFNNIDKRDIKFNKLIGKEENKLAGTLNKINIKENNISKPFLPTIQSEIYLNTIGNNSNKKNILDNKSMKKKVNSNKAINMNHSADKEKKFNLDCNDPFTDRQKELQIFNQIESTIRKAESVKKMRKLPKIELNNENRKSNANISLDIESIINNEINKNNVTNIKQSQKGVILDGNQKYNLRRNISYISRKQRYNTLDQKENNIANHMSYEDFIKKINYKETFKVESSKKLNKLNKSVDRKSKVKRSPSLIIDCNKKFEDNTNKNDTSEGKNTLDYLKKKNPEKKEDNKENELNKNSKDNKKELSPTEVEVNKYLNDKMEKNNY